MEESSSSSSSRSSLFELPYDVFVDCLVPFIPTRDLARLRQTCKTLQQWVDDEFIWRKRIADDFNFPEHASARVTGWQQLYRGLSSPELFTWGESTQGRLGVDFAELDRETRTFFARHDHIGGGPGGAPFPLKVDYQDPKRWKIRRSDGLFELDSRPSKAKSSIGTPVKIAASGWGFHVLTTTGKLLAWGPMNGDDPYDRNWTTTPSALCLHETEADGEDVRVRQLSCGRAHGVALTVGGEVLEWRGWKGILPHDEPLLPPEAIPAHGIASLAQLEAGWDFNVALFHIKSSIATPLTQAASSNGSNLASRIVYWRNDWVSNAGSSRGRVGTIYWLRVPKVVLPPLPAPPADIAEEMGMASKDTTRLDDGQQQQQLVRQVAAGEDYVIALTSSGLIYKLDVSPGSDEDVGPRALGEHYDSRRLRRVLDDGARSWQLMEHFCVPSRIAALAGFAPRPGNERLASLVSDREKLKIKHISAQFRTWAAYTTAAPASTTSESLASRQGSAPDQGGIVLLGKGDAVAETGPLVKPELQGAGVIKISVGDWHYGALTSSGRVMTWGAWSNGALGIWDSLPLAQQSQQQPPPQTQTPLLGRFRIGLAGTRLGVRQPLAQQQGPSAQQQGSAVRDRLAARIIPRQGVDVPTEVRFDGDEEKARRTFVFDIAFAGWQSAAIAIDSRLVDGGQEEDGADAMEEDQEEEQETLHQDSPSDGELSQGDQGVSSRNAASSSSSPFSHAPPSSTTARQRQPFNARQIVSSASSIPSLGPIASSSITTPLLPPSTPSPAATPTANTSHEHERLPLLLTLTSLLFLTIGLAIVLGFPTSGLSLSDPSSYDGDEAGGGMWVWTTRLSFWALLLIPMYLYATIARWVGESMGRG